MGYFVLSCEIQSWICWGRIGVNTELNLLRICCSLWALALVSWLVTLFYLRCSEAQLCVLCFSGICPEFPLRPARCRGGFHSRGGSKWSLLSHAHDSASWSVILQRFRWQCTLSLHGKCVVGFILNKFWYVEVKSMSLVSRGFRK